ncbi:MAG: hypothetical protein WAK20_07655 [Candidatus Acidiferrum sp.]
MINPQTKRQARLWLAVVFLLGAGIGTAFGYAFAHKSYAASTPTQLSEPERRAKRIADMTQAIGLTPEQSQKFDAIILSAHQEMKKAHDQSEVDIDAIREKARAQMKELLAPEQKVKFDEFVKRLDEERKRMAGNQAGGR